MANSSEVNYHKNENACINSSFFLFLRFHKWKGLFSHASEHTEGMAKFIHDYRMISSM